MIWKVGDHSHLDGSMVRSPPHAMSLSAVRASVLSIITKQKLLDSIEVPRKVEDHNFYVTNSHIFQKNVEILLYVAVPN